MRLYRLLFGRYIQSVRVPVPDILIGYLVYAMSSIVVRCAFVAHKNLDLIDMPVDSIDCHAAVFRALRRPTRRHHALHHIEDTASNPAWCCQSAIDHATGQRWYVLSSLTSFFY